MPSTDIDGSVVVILSKKEAEYVYGLLDRMSGPFNETTQTLANKLARDLNRPKIERTDNGN